MAPGRFNRRGIGGNQFRSRITDARQILQRRNTRKDFTDLSEKLVSRNSITARLGRGFNNNRIRKPLNRGRFNNNSGNLQLNRNRFQNNLSMRNQTGNRFQRVYPNQQPRMQLSNINRNQYPNQQPRMQLSNTNRNQAGNKFIQVHRSGITVTSGQNTFQRMMMQKHVAEDELEEMTLADLPELEPVNKNPLQTLEFEAQSIASNRNTTVLISNLKHTVTEEDLNELFGVVGTLSQVQMLHPGTALVSYYRKEEALSAVESYHNVTLDGMPMHCSILTLENASAKPSITSRLGERASLPSSASFLSPPQPRSSSSFIPQTFPTYATPRLVQPHVPVKAQFTTRPPNRTKFTVCLN